jgi:serine kinase of HPr protein (carbohydrate metabolism regulator)
LRLIDGGAALVADDQVQVRAQGDRLLASPPAALKGLLEIRGLGIVTLAYCEETALAFAVRLVVRDAVERLPEPAFFDCEGRQLPLLSLHAFDAATPAKIRMYLQAGIL